MTRTKRSTPGALHAGAGRQGKVIMTRKRVFEMLAVIAFLAVSATGAQAGSGGSPSALTSFFVCKTINGDDAARSVDVQAFDTDPANAGIGWGFTLQGVRIGNATLACAFAKLFRPGTTTEISPNPANSFKDLKCYSISVSRSQTQTGTPQSYTVHDNLFPGGVDSNVPGSAVQYICAPATFNPNP
jgi:hypothetical protein